jgi:hypothetical protein
MMEVFGCPSQICLRLMIRLLYLIMSGSDGYETIIVGYGTIFGENKKQ